VRVPGNDVLPRLGELNRSRPAPLWQSPGLVA